MSRRITFKGLLLQEILALPSSRPLSAEEQEEHDFIINQHRARFPHNRRPRFSALIRLPSEAILGYRYACDMINRYGTADTKSDLDKDYTIELDPNQSPDLDDGHSENHTPSDEGSHSKGYRRRLDPDSRRAGRKPSRNVPKDEDAAAATWGEDLVLNIQYRIHVPPYEAAVRALRAREAEGKRQFMQEWVDAQRSSY